MKYRLLTLYIKAACDIPLPHEARQPANWDAAKFSSNESVELGGVGLAVCGAAPNRRWRHQTPKICRRKYSDNYSHTRRILHWTPHLFFLFRFPSLDFPLLHNGCGWRNIPFHLWYLSSVRRFVVNLWRVGGWRTSRQNLRSNFRCHRTCPTSSKKGKHRVGLT